MCSLRLSTSWSGLISSCDITVTRIWDDITENIVYKGSGMTFRLIRLKNKLAKKIIVNENQEYMILDQKVQLLEFKTW